MKSMISLMRPEQWMKNIFVILPLFFSGKMLQTDNWLTVVWVLISFSFAASSIYILNDLIDADADAQHPKKCERPIPRGLVSKPVAMMMALMCAVVAILLSWLLCGKMITVIITGYCLLNIAYCLILKQLAVVDVLIVAFGFLLRLLAGGIAADVVLSQWIVLVTFLLALFLALAKRRDDVLIYEKLGVRPRVNITQYNLVFINLSMGVMAAVLIVCYIMYTVSPEVTHRLNTSYLYLTTLFVIAGMLRYMQITFVKQESGSPTHVLMHDHFIQLCVLCWAVSFAVILYY